MSNNKTISTLSHAVLAFSLSSLAVAAFAEELRIGGGAAPFNNIFKKIQAPFEKATGIKLILREDGPDIAMIQLDHGQILRIDC